MIYIVFGTLAGIISGMGLGGGVILIPFLTLLNNYTQQQAQSINLIYFIPTAIIALITHRKNNNIEKNLGLGFLIVFGILGGVIGSYIALNLDPSLLKQVFAFFMLSLGIKSLLNNKHTSKNIPLLKENYKV